MTAPVSITIDGQPYNILESEVSIEQIMGQTIAISTVTIFDKDCSVTIPEMKEIFIYRPDTGDTLFAGLTTLPSEWPEGVSRYIEVKCQDFGVLLDRTLILANYPAGWINPTTLQGSDRGMIEDVFANKCLLSSGALGASEIDASLHVTSSGITLAAVQFLYWTLREFLSSLASTGNRDFRVDANKRLWYYLVSVTHAPFDLDSTPDFTAVPPKVGYRMGKNNRFYRDCTSISNAIWPFGNNLFSDDKTFILASDGVSTEVGLTPDVLGLNAILVAPTGQDGSGNPYEHVRVLMNSGSDAVPSWTELAVGLYGTTDAMPPSDVLHDVMGQRLYFASAPPALSSSVKIIARYQIGNGGGTAISDAASLASYGRTFARRLVASDVNAVTQLNQKAATLLSRYKGPLKRVTLTVEDWMFPPGNLNRFTVGNWVRWHNGVLNRTEDMLVYKTVTRIVGGTIRAYDLELRNYV